MSGLASLIIGSSYDEEPLIRCVPSASPEVRSQSQTSEVRDPTKLRIADRGLKRAEGITDWELGTLVETHSIRASVIDAETRPSPLALRVL